tara:strand:+ start:3911 stop:4075 length:165 start_codon:yes stop_codon:yes gene_type:complete
MKMNEERRESLYKILEYAAKALQYEERNDSHWKICVSLLRHELGALKKTYDEEE